MGFSTYQRLQLYHQDQRDTARTLQARLYLDGPYRSLSLRPPHRNLKVIRPVSHYVPFIRPSAKDFYELDGSLDWVVVPQYMSHCYEPWEGPALFNIRKEDTLVDSNILLEDMGMAYMLPMSRISQFFILPAAADAKVAPKGLEHGSFHVVVVPHGSSGDLGNNHVGFPIIHAEVAMAGSAAALETTVNKCLRYKRVRNVTDNFNGEMPRMEHGKLRVSGGQQFKPVRYTDVYYLGDVDALKVQRRRSRKLEPERKGDLWFFFDGILFVSPDKTAWLPYSLFKDRTALIKCAVERADRDTVLGMDLQLEYKHETGNRTLNGQPILRTARTISFGDLQGSVKRCVKHLELCGIEANVDERVFADYARNELRRRPGWNTASASAVVV